LLNISGFLIHYRGILQHYEYILKLIAQELVNSVKRSVSVDWTKRENARAQIRVKVKRILRKYGYPPDMQARATELVLEQATVLCKEWAT
ncbi:MAG TPA: DUF3387 domain-containing protein, partial [Gammaproteobacteria bacterium]|nr:DUF3387 domain-containing protein [Gammaproteobacteria bacterium]